MAHRGGSRALAQGPAQKEPLGKGPCCSPEALPGAKAPWILSWHPLPAPPLSSSSWQAPSFPFYLFLYLLFSGTCCSTLPASRCHLCALPQPRSRGQHPPEGSFCTCLAPWFYVGGLGFTGAAVGHPLVTWLPEARMACSGVPQDCYHGTGNSWQTPTPGAVQRETETPPSLSAKRPVCWFGLRGLLLVWHT